MSNFPSTNNQRYWKILKPNNGAGERSIWSNDSEIINDIKLFLEYIENNPKKINIGHYKGEQVDIKVDNVPNKWSFAAWMGVSYQSLMKYQKLYPEVFGWFESICYGNIFQGAMIGTYNANLASRYLGLADKREVTGNQIVEVNLYIPKVEPPKQIEAALDEFDDLTWE